MRVLAIALLITLGACEFPRDPDGTLHRVAQGTLRAGAMVSPPWIEEQASGVGGLEAILVQAAANELGARVAWTVGAYNELMDALHAGGVDVLAGGLRASDPHSEGITFTRPYVRDRVLAVRKGENAWLVRLERFFASDRARALVEAA